MHKPSNARHAALALVIGAFTGSLVQAQTTASSQTQYSAESKQLAMRYKEDQQWRHKATHTRRAPSEIAHR
jgi:nuclear transport factor 2 (NTF2) superfamily protein